RSPRRKRPRRVRARGPRAPGADPARRAGPGRGRRGRRRTHHPGRRPQPRPGNARGGVSDPVRGRVPARRAGATAGLAPHVPSGAATPAGLDPGAGSRGRGGPAGRDPVGRGSGGPRPLRVRLGPPPAARGRALRPGPGARAVSDLAWWAWALLVIGAVSTVAVLGSLLLPDFHKPPLTCECREPSGSEDFLAALSRYFNVPLLRGGTAEILQNGCRFFPALLDAIRGARDTINFECYIFESGDIGREIVDALVERARAGVEVRMLLDAFGSLGLERRDRERLRRAGVKLQFFRPLSPFSLVRAFKRDHRRAIVIDGEIAFTGGAAVADKWNGDARNRREWRDSLTRVTGAL